MENRQLARRLDIGASFESDAMQLGQVMAQSGFFSDTKDAAQAVVKILAGKELGFGPVASMVGVYIVKGKVSLSANLIAAAIKRSGRYNYRVRELSDHACRIEFFEGRESVGLSEFTIEDAQKAGLLGNQTWKQYPRNMLFARAMSNGARFYCADVFGGPLYTPEELGAHVAVSESGEAEVVSLPPERPIPAAISAPPSADTDAGMAELVERARALYRECKTRGLSPTKPASTTDVDVLGAWLDEWQTKLDDWNRDAVPFNEDDDDTAALAGVPL